MQRQQWQQRRERHRQKASDKSADYYHTPTRLKLQLTSLPQHGVLFISKARAEKGQYFEQVSLLRSG